MSGNSDVIPLSAREILDKIKEGKKVAVAIHNTELAEKRFLDLFANLNVIKSRDKAAIENYGLVWKNTIIKMELLERNPNYTVYVFYGVEPVDPIKYSTYVIENKES